MLPELYFDISAEDSGGSLYRTNNGGVTTFVYHHSTYNDDGETIQSGKTPYASFELFWKSLQQNKEWFYLHPLYVHPEQREFVRAQLDGVNWQVQGDGKWQESHRRQWKKVLSDPAQYYQPPGSKQYR